MELNKLSLFTQNAAALNKTQNAEDKKAADKAPQEEVRDNKPAEKQVAGEDVLTFMASKNIDFAVTAKKPADAKKSPEDRIAGYMSDFESAYNEAASLGLSEDAINAILDKMSA